MYLLRRAAVRTISSQPSRHLSTLRSIPTLRATLPRPSSSIAIRSVHQTRIRLAEDQLIDRKPEQSGETDADVASPAEASTLDETVPPEALEQHEEDLAAAEVDVDVAAAQNTETVPEAVIVEGESDAVPEELVDDSDAAVLEGEGGMAAEEVAATSAAAAATAQAFTPPPPSSQGPPGTRTRTPFPNDPSSGRASGSSFRDIQPSRILYIGNLFFEVTAPQLEAEFSSFGAVTNSRVVTDSRGLSKGFAYVEFAEQDAADAAVRELDQKVFQGRRMAVQYHVKREPKRFGERGGDGRSGAGGVSGSGDRRVNAPSKTLFIGNMSYQMSDRDLNDLFREIKDVLDVRVAIDRRSGQPRGFAHADFIDVPSAEKAKRVLEAKVIYGRQLRVDFSGSSKESQQSPRG